MTEPRYTAFCGFRRIADGPLVQVAAVARTVGEPVLIFDDSNAEPVELDLRGTEAEVLARLPSDSSSASSVPPTAQRGRPRLGVVAREVTLLPRHWQWLNAQPGGASVALRKLVEAARGQNAVADAVRTKREAAYRFLSAVAGNLPGYEEALRALFAADRDSFAARMAGWPADVRDYALRLGFAAVEK